MTTTKGLRRRAPLRITDCMTSTDGFYVEHDPEDNNFTLIAYESGTVDSAAIIDMGRADALRLSNWLIKALDVDGDPPR